MTVTIPIADAQKSLATVARRVKSKKQRVLLATRGKPQVALVSLTDLERLQNDKFQLSMARDWPALLSTVRQLRAAMQAKKYRRAQQLLADIDDFLAMNAVADEPTRPWEEFVAELDAHVSNRH